MGRPVKVTLTRPESFQIHPEAAPDRAHLQDRLRCRRAYHGGSSAQSLATRERTPRWARRCWSGPAATAPGRTACRPIDMESLAVYTNNPPCGAMRGFGANQAAFAIENLLDRLAEKVGIDAYDMRDRNILEPGETFATGQVLDKPFGLRKTLEAVQRRVQVVPSTPASRAASRTAASATACPISASRRSTLLVPMTIHIHTGFTEMGQGLFTLCIQFAVEATDLPAEVFKKVSTDTKFLLDCGQTTASRATVLAGQLDRRSGQAAQGGIRGRQNAGRPRRPNVYRRMELHVHVEARLRPR